MRQVIIALLFIPSSALATTVGPQTELAITAQSSQRAPAIAWDGTQYVMVYEDGRNQATTGVDLYVARISSAGVLMDQNGIGLLENSVLPSDQTQPAIVCCQTSGVHLIAWQSAHLGSPDIFVARFLSGSGTTVPSAGVLVTGGNANAESAPAVSFTANQYVIAFQTSIAAASRIQARRLQLDGVNFSDAAPFNVSNGSSFETEPEVLSAGTNFLVAWQDDRNGNLDLFARNLPDSGAVPASPGIAIFTGATAQRAIALAPLGAGNFVSVFEDGSNTADFDLSGRRFTAALTILGNTIDVSSAINDEFDPEVAGDLNGALAVWQDRRDSIANAITYAARLDASGNVLDPRGFPVLAYNGNAFEQTVVKGPNNDYLVASVRLGNPDRIHYRIVRIEPPSGSMTASGPTSVPADGVTRAALTFGPAAGASGLPVVDGTLYTVSLSQAGVEIVAPDLDPVIPGHQVGSFDGEVYLELRTDEHVMCDVMLTSVEGNSSGMTTIEFVNVPPVVNNVVVTPMPMARSDQDLMLSYAYSDVNGDPESGSIIQWTRNSAVQGQIQGTTVPASATIKGDQWAARVFPSDGLPGAPTSVGSNVVTIGNSPPLATNLRIRPATDIRTGTEIEAIYIFDDPDNDAETGTELRWFDRGTERPDLMDTPIITGAQVIKGQQWSFTVLPHDGTEPGALATSPEITVLNTAPIADAGPDGSVLERRSYQLDATASSDVDPQDGLTFAWAQVENGAPTVQLTSTSSPTPSFVAPSVAGTTSLQFDLTVSDGEEPSIADRVVVVISLVQNSDEDDLDDEEEAELGTDPEVGDTDRDGLDDFVEVRQAMTDPLDEDSDDDGVRDGAEGQTCRNCPADPMGDADADLTINALDPDSDADLILDGTELGVRTALEDTDVAAGAFVADADPDTATNPIAADTDLDTFSDGTEDANQNGRLDPGENDPNDPTDPGITCTPGGNECPAGLVCGADNLCVFANGDGGATCMPLSEALECCMGGCAGAGTKVDPICTQNGAMESCPIGADQCRAGSCEPDMINPTKEGCGCTAAERTEGSAAWWLLGLALLSRSAIRVGCRRRRGSRAS